MRRITILAAALALSTAPALFAGPQMAVTLKDNSTLRGELVEFSNGVYRLKTDALGEVKIPADKVLIMQTADAEANAAAQAGADSHTGKKAPKSPAIREGGAQSRPAEPAATPQPAGPASDNLQDQQKSVNSQVQSMLMDGSFMDNVTNLGQSEKMQDVLQDPQVMEAIQRGDYEFLMNNEKMKNLIESSDMQNILGGMSPEDAGE